MSANKLGNFLAILMKPVAWILIAFGYGPRKAEMETVKTPFEERKRIMAVIATTPKASLFRTKTFWTALGGLVTGVGMCVLGDPMTGAQTIILSLLAITGRDGMVKIENQV